MLCTTMSKSPVMLLGVCRSDRAIRPPWARARTCVASEQASASATVRRVRLCAVHESTSRLPRTGRTSCSVTSQPPPALDLGEARGSFTPIVVSDGKVTAAGLVLSGTF